MEGIATREEIKRSWTLVDLLHCHELLDFKGDIEIYQQKEHEKAMKRGK